MNQKDIEIFKLNSAKEIKKLYQDHRPAFLQFGKRYGLAYDDLSDIYQEAFIALRDHALHGKLNEVKSSLKTYLFGIGKNLIFNKLQEERKLRLYQETIEKEYPEIPLIDTDSELLEPTLQQKRLKTFFKKLGEKCQEVLTLFYARGLTIDEIVLLTNYTSNSVVRSQKSRCLKSLKEMIKTNE